MRKTFNFFYAFLLALLGFGVTLMAEDITLTTYYPAPYGAYNELSVSQTESTNNTTSALIVSSTDDNTLAPVVSASTKLNGMLLSSDDATAAYYILNIRSGASLTSRFYVRNDGNVGIGTTDPKAAIDVNGAIAISGTPGIDGSFIDLNNRVVTVKKGIITSITP